MSQILALTEIWQCRGLRLGNLTYINGISLHILVALFIHDVDNGSINMFASWTGQPREVMLANAGD